MAINPDLDLQLVRIVDIAPELVWQAYTQPELLTQWFCPRPWTVSACEIDLRQGGRFHTVMRSPEGEEFPADGCYLEVVPNRRLVWTNGLQPGYRPAVPSVSDEGLQFTAVIDIARHGTGTKYTATVLHADAASQQRHAAMGFEFGWGAAFDQLVALMSR